MAGFNKPKKGNANIDDNLSNRGAAPKPPRAKRNQLVGQKSDLYSNDASSQHHRSVISQGLGSRRGLATKNDARQNIPDMRSKKQRAGTKTRGNDGDFE